MEESEGFQLDFCGMLSVLLSSGFALGDMGTNKDAHSLQAVYQSLLHLGWIDKLLDNISTIFIDLYKDQLKSTRAHITEYKFDRYFDQQVQELEDNTGSTVAAEALAVDGEDKKDPLVSSDNGGPPPPPVPGLLKGIVTPACSQGGRHC